MPLWLGKRAQSYSWADCDLCGHVHVCHLSGLGRRLEQRTREGRRQALHRCEGQVQQELSIWRAVWEGGAGWALARTSSI